MRRDKCAQGHCNKSITASKRRLEPTGGLGVEQDSQNVAKVEALLADGWASSETVDGNVNAQDKPFADWKMNNYTSAFAVRFGLRLGRQNEAKEKIQNRGRKEEGTSGVSVLWGVRFGE